MDAISNTPVERSPLKKMQAKIRVAEMEFTEALRIEFAAMYARAKQLEEEIHQARFEGDEHLRKLLGRALKELSEVVNATLPF